jgi:hypothetical protein
MSRRAWTIRDVRRVLAAFADTTDDGDIGALTELAELHRELDHLIDVRVKAMIALGYSWRQIGAAVQPTKQRAHQRWRHLGGARHPGGQPADRR